MNINRLMKGLRLHFPKPRFHGNRDPFKVLISTIISQRTRDEQTHEVSERLFRRYGTPKALANADSFEIERLIKPAGFYRVKAKKIKEVSSIIQGRYHGKVPDTIDELLQLPSVGRKTANCVLVFGFQIPAIPVDTHVHRISNRLGLVDTKLPEETEVKLMKVLPKKYWLEFNELLVRFGQNVCRPISPKCEVCNVSSHCRYYKTNNKLTNEL